MSKSALMILCSLAVCAPLAFAGVNVNSPSNGATLQGPVYYSASATTSCSKGVSAMGIYTAPGVLAYVTNGSNLSTNLNLSPGTYNTVVESWDGCGQAATAAVTITVSNQSGVHISSPSNGGNPGSPVNFSANASTSCSKGVGSMGIYTSPYQLAYVTGGSNINTNLSLSPGNYNAVVVGWDNCGGASVASVSFSVGSNGHSFNNLQASGGWGQAGQGPPDFVDCNPCGPQINWAMYQGIRSPSMSGNATQYNIGGNGPYWDVLFNNHLIGPFSSQGMPDNNHTIVPGLYNFTYDVYFFGNNLGASQALEFDFNQFFNGMGFIWGHECRIAGGNEWDVWDNVNSHWLHTGVPCHPNSNQWNHLTLQVQRTGDNQLLYKSITLNGVTNTLNWYLPHGQAPQDWYGVTINYQMDGNNVQSPYTVYLDNLTFSYW